MKKRILWIFAVVVAVCALSYSAIAQPPGGPGGPPPGGPGGFGGGMRGGGVVMGGGPGGFGNVFQNPEFAKMLELTPEQIDSLRNVATEVGNDMREKMREIMTPGTPPNPDVFRKEMEKMMDESQTKINKVLKPEQQTKAQEIAFQLSGGLNAPMGIRTLETLNLTDAQKEQVRKMMSERDAEGAAAMQSFDWRNSTPEEREKMRTDNEARAKKYAEQIATLLTPEQKAKADKLTAGADALREKLGMPAPGQRGGQQGQQRGQQGRQGGQQGGYVPGANSWRPGQEVPNAPPPQPNRPGNFPRRPQGN